MLQRLAVDVLTSADSLGKLPGEARKRMSEPSGLKRRIGQLLREVAAPLAWCYAITELLVFDVDGALLRAAAPSFVWLLDYKFFVLLGVAVLLLLLLGSTEFLWLGAFVVGYPFVPCWRLIKRYYRQWPVALVFSPVIWGAVERWRSTFLLYSLAAFAALFILTNKHPIVLVTWVACLCPLLIVHLGRGLRKAFSAGPPARLTAVLESLRAEIEGGSMPWDKQPAPTVSAERSSTRPSDPRETAYFTHALAEYVAGRVRTVAKRRHYDAYLAGSWLFTMILVALLFALGHLGLHKALPGAYAAADGAGLGSFLGYSLGALTTSNLSRITPISPLASVVSYAEVVCSALFLVIYVFLFFGAARDTFRENLDDLDAAIKGVATAVDSRIRAKWQLTVDQLEIVLLVERPSYVNSVRRSLRGLPALPLRDASGQPVSQGQAAGAGT
jgi:hypothetical protein